MTKEEFIKKAREIHGWKYDYSMVQFKSNKDKVAIICPEHGVFYKTIEKHLYAKQGCPECIGKKRYTNEEFLRKIETLPNAPPENKSRNPIMLFPPAILEKISLFIPKIGS